MSETLASPHISALFPAGVAVCFSAALPGDARLYAAETATVGGMVEKRRDEFLHGRYCAREALQNLQVAPQAIPRAMDRSPQWPAGIVGSITHSGPLAAAAVARAAAYRGVGLDIETAEALDVAAIELILRPDERHRHDARQAKLLFSIKEAVYKCIYPLVRCYVDFQEMHIRVDPGSGRYTATPYCDKFDPAVMTGLQGRYTVAADYVASSAWLST